MRTLIIEDDQEIAGFLDAHLPAHGFACDLADTGEEGTRLSRLHSYDLVILDLNLPDMNGEEVIRHIREESPTVPVLMLTVVGDPAMKVRLLSAGADDYLEKPFSFEELVARMRALLRRSHEVIPDLLYVGDLKVDAQQRLAWYRSRLLPLTRKEFALLEYLVRRHGSVIPKEELIEHVWNAKADLFSNAVETHLANVRKKIGKGQLIRTVHGRGYVIGEE